MNNVTKFKPRRRPTPFPVVVALVVSVGAAVGVGAHLASERGAVDAIIDRFETAAVTLPATVSMRTKEAITPVKVADTWTKAETTSRRFGLCSGAIRTTCVVDGDTIWLDGTKIRIADIDTPEVGQPKCRAEKALGDKATRRLLQLVNAGPFELRAWEGRDEDKHGRKLRVLVRGRRSLGDVLVSEGLARTWSGRREPWC